MLDIDLLLTSEGLYRTAFPDGTRVTYRLLTLKEYRVFRALRDGEVLHPYQVAGMVFDRCNLGGELANVVRAGVAISVGMYIMYRSGDCDLETLKEDLLTERSAYQHNSVLETIKRIICIAFPSCKWEDFDQLTRPELLRRFTVAESILVNKGDNYTPMDLKKIKSIEEIQAERKVSSNFAEENAILRKAIGRPDENGEIQSGSMMGLKRALKR